MLGSKEMVKVKMLCDRGHMGRLAKDSLDIMGTYGLMHYTGRLTIGNPHGFIN
jgi:hypothetical protein